jgi:cyclophilin family peptidyl-prolyl cis-trans isomerase
MKRFPLILMLAVLAAGVTTYLVVKGPAANSDDKVPKKVVVVMETSMGTIEIELNGDKAPITVKNFLAYVEDKFFDNTLFHRVIENFMIQGGGFAPGLERKKTRAAIKNEAGNGLSNVRGTIAMARIDDPDSATSQFFINVGDNSRLDRSEGSAGYCVFGKVIKGMDIVDKIREVETHTAYKEVKIQGETKRIPFANAPVEDVVIKSVRVKK